MRNFIVGLMAFILTLFPGCTPVRSAYQQITNNTNVAAPIIIDAIKERDIDALETIMCNNIKENVEDLPEKIGELIDAIDGEIIESSWEDRGGSYQASDGEGKIIVQAGLDIYFTTTEGTYVVAVWWETVNTFKPEETGIRNIALCDPDLAFTDNYVLAKISATEGISEWHD